MYLHLPMGGFWVRSCSSLEGPKCHIYTEPLPAPTLNSHPPYDVPPASQLMDAPHPLPSGVQTTIFWLLGGHSQTTVHTTADLPLTSVAPFSPRMWLASPLRSSSLRAVWAPRGTTVSPTLPKWLFQKSFCFCYTLTTKELILKQKGEKKRQLCDKWLRTMK